MIVHQQATAVVSHESKASGSTKRSVATQNIPGAHSKAMISGDLMSSPFEWSPRYKDQANEKLLKYLGIDVKIIADGVRGHSLGMEPYRVLVTHKQPSQQFFHTLYPPVDPLKLLLLKNSSNEHLVVSVR